MPYKEIDQDMKIDGRESSHGIDQRIFEIRGAASGPSTGQIRYDLCSSGNPFRDGKDGLKRR
jgi:hypothetical protein